MKTISFSAGLFAFVLSLTAVADPSEARGNWPQWRGPLASGVAPDADPPLEWTETKNVRWKVTVPGAGSSTPVVWANRVFVLTAVPAAKSAETKLADAKPT